MSDLTPASAQQAEEDGYYKCRSDSGGWLHGADPNEHENCIFVKSNEPHDGYCDPVEPCWAERQKMNLSKFATSCTYLYRLETCLCVEKELLTYYPYIKNTGFIDFSIETAISNNPELAQNLYYCQK